MTIDDVREIPAGPEPAIDQDEHLGEDYALTAAFVEKVVDAADAGDGMRLRDLLEDLHPADIADLMGFLTAEHRSVVVAWLPRDMLGEVLPELDDDIREQVLERLPSGALAEALRELDSDDAAAVVEEMEEDQRREVLAAMPEQERAAIESSLGYEEESAGRLMQREVMAAPQFWSVGDTIDHLRAQGEDLPELFFDIYVVDPQYRPVGGVAVSRLLRSGRNVKLTALMEPVNEIEVHQDQEEVAYIFEKYHLISAPVVDVGGRLVGQITVDDIVNIIQEENREDILRLAGVSDEGRDAGVFSIVRSRLPWLIVNLVTAGVAASVISAFEDQIERLVTLAVIMPIVASLGGNAGAQTLAVAVRALAGRELNAANATRIVLREARVGLIHGGALALMMSTGAFIFFHDPMLSLTIAMALVINMFVASLSGILVPLTLDRLGRDPAVSSSVFITFMTDFMGFLSFLGLASILLL